MAAKKTARKPVPTPAAPRDKSRNPEVYAPELLLRAMRQGPRWERDARWEWAEGHFGGLNYWRGQGGKSDNHGRMLAAAILWRGEDVGPLLLFWRALLRYQLGHDEPPEDLRLARRLNAQEPGSNNYGGMSLGSADATRLWCLTHPDAPHAAEVADLCAEYARVVCWLASLGACDSPLLEARYLRPDEETIIRPHAHRSGRSTWWRGPTLPGPGGRSTVSHLGNDGRLPGFMRLFHDVPSDPERFGWPAEASNRLLRHVGPHDQGAPTEPWQRQDLALAALASIRLTARLHYVRWGDRSDHVLSYMEQNPSPNTASIMFHYQRGTSGVVGYPHPGRVRGGGNVDRGQCGIEGGRIVARTRHGEVSMELPREAPASHVVVGENGVEVLT